MAFQFSLEKLLRLKRLFESEAVQRLERSRLARESCEQLLSELEDARGDLFGALTPNECVSAAEMLLWLEHLHWLDLWIQETRERKTALDQAFDERRADVTARVVERRAHEQSREQSFERFQRTRKKRDQKREDEIASRARPRVLAGSEVDDE